MKKLNVLKAFVLTLEDGTTRAFKTGLQELEAHLHNHWFVKAHSEAVEAAPAVPTQKTK